jgi:hypothetical protein
VGAKAKKSRCTRVWDLQPFEEMAKKVLEPLRTVMLGIFLTKSWFRNLNTTDFPAIVLESRYLQQTFLIQTADNIKDIR